MRVSSSAMTTPAARRYRKLLGVGGGSVALALALLVSFGSPLSAFTATADIDLGDAASFSIRGSSTVVNTGPAIINGDTGVAPGSAITGF